MKIHRWFRCPLPGARDVPLRGDVRDPDMLEIESNGLWEVIVSRLAAHLRDAIERLARRRRTAEEILKNVRAPVGLMFRAMTAGCQWDRQLADEVLQEIDSAGNVTGISGRVTGISLARPQDRSTSVSVSYILLNIHYAH